ncbi:hypothetical protein MMC20_004532 [Loxospora ochrophaea]|nr:hypothetical protein [Loxospora ochrophaea]
MHWKIEQIEEKQQALYVGFFGPIGVSAVFYLYVSLEYLNGITVNGTLRDDVSQLEEVMTVVVWFLAICSIVVHGLSVPLGKLGYHLPRTLSSAPSRDEIEPEPLHNPESLGSVHWLKQRTKAKVDDIRCGSPMSPIRLGRTVIQPRDSEPSSPRPEQFQLRSPRSVSPVNSLRITPNPEPPSSMESRMPRVQSRHGREGQVENEMDELHRTESV